MPRSEAGRIPAALRLLLRPAPPLPASLLPVLGPRSRRRRRRCRVPACLPPLPASTSSPLPLSPSASRQPTEWKRMLSEGQRTGEMPLVLDVRNSYEWDAGHFVGAERPLEVGIWVSRRGRAGQCPACKGVGGAMSGMRGLTGRLQLRPRRLSSLCPMPLPWLGLRCRHPRRDTAGTACRTTSTRPPPRRFRWRCPPFWRWVGGCRAALPPAAAAAAAAGSICTACDTIAACPPATERRPRPTSHDLLHWRHPLRRLWHLSAQEGVRVRRCHAAAASVPSCASHFPPGRSSCRSVLATALIFPARVLLCRSRPCCCLLCRSRNPCPCP